MIDGGAGKKDASSAGQTACPSVYKKDASSAGQTACPSVYKALVPIPGKVRVHLLFRGLVRVRLLYTDITVIWPHYTVDSIACAAGRVDDETERGLCVLQSHSSLFVTDAGCSHAQAQP